MSSTSGEDEQSGPRPTALEQADVAPAPASLDDVLGRGPDFVQPSVDLIRSMADALDAARAGLDVGYDAARLNRGSAETVAPITGESFQRSAPTLAGTWGQATASVRSFVSGIGSWVTKAAKAAREKVAEHYRRAAPPNWTTDPDAAVADYDRAVQLALDEGIPLAWVPDQVTVNRLLAVPVGAADRTARLRAILRERMEIILDHCDERLDQIAAIPNPSARQRQSLEFARQALQALRSGLTAPAQAAATSVIETLLDQAFSTIDGHYQQRTVRERVHEVSQRTRTSGMSSQFLQFLGTLREVATLVPAFTAMEPWRPKDDVPPPTTFSRHVTVHQLTAPNQVNPVNALVAVMLAISLLSQEHDSGWNSCTTAIKFDVIQAALRARRISS
jgi:hypothetical protein